MAIIKDSLLNNGINYVCKYYFTAGTIHVGGDLNTEDVAQYSFQVCASDGNTSHTVCANVSIDVIDVNDNKPRILDAVNGEISIHVYENNKKGTSLINITATDDDCRTKEGCEISFRLLTGNLFYILYFMYC